MPLQKTTKEEIVKTCIKVFRRQGYYRTTMADLARETGMTKGALYHHFPSKEDIMKTALNGTIDWFTKKIFSIAYSQELSNKEKLEKMSTNAYKGFTDELGGCFFANTILETAHIENTFLEQVKTFFKLWEDAFVEILKQKYKPKEAKEIALRSIVDIEGSLILMQLHKDNKYLENAFQRVKKLI